MFVGCVKMCQFVCFLKSKCIQVKNLQKVPQNRLFTVTIKVPTHEANLYKNQISKTNFNSFPNQCSSFYLFIHLLNYQFNDIFISYSFSFTSIFVQFVKFTFKCSVFSMNLKISFSQSKPFTGFAAVVLVYVASTHHWLVLSSLTSLVSGSNSPD